MGIPIVLSNTSAKPIYAQISDQIRAAILSGLAAPGFELPSIRRLAQDLRVSVITTKRAYDDLEREGFLVASPGRGCFVAEPNVELVREARLREVEEHLGKAVSVARSAGIDKSSVEEMLDLLWKEESGDGSFS